MIVLIIPHITSPIIAGMYDLSLHGRLNWSQLTLLVCMTYPYMTGSVFGLS